MTNLSRAVLIVVSVTSLALALKPLSDTRHLEIIPAERNEPNIARGMKIETGKNIPRVIYQIRQSVDPSDPETMARQFLSDNSVRLKLNKDLSDLKLKAIRHTPGGIRVRFTQMYEAIDVYNSEIVVSFNNSNQVVFLVNDYHPDLKVGTTEPKINAKSAEQIARNYISAESSAAVRVNSPMIYENLTLTALVHRIIITSFGEISGDWEILVNSLDGEILRAKDLRSYHEDFRTSGDGTVFDPDPVTRAQTIYGNDGFVDDNDNDNLDLNAQLVPVTLQDITYNSSSGLYMLDGPYAQIVDYEGPYTGLYTQDSNDFTATRSQDLFEAVNIYHHLHHSMQYINETLGFDIMPFQYNGGVRYDPHGLNGDMNAHYTWDGYVAFGSPSYNVDLGEDHSVVLHELGHGIHDWVTNGALSQNDGLSEGCSDFWAQSYTRSLGFFVPGDEQYDWFSVWGFSPYLRVTNFSGHYPESLNGQVHHDGQLWSSSLMSIYDQVGKVVTDMDFLEALSMTGSNTDQEDAAWAYIQADENLFDGDHLSVIGPVFADRGYIDATLTVDFSAELTGGTAPLPVEFDSEVFALLNEITYWEWDLNGDGTIDSYDLNPMWTYDAPGLYTISLTVSDGVETLTETKVDYISVNSGIFVWDGHSSGQGHSGDFIADLLEESSLFPAFSHAAALPTTLMGYDAVFLSLGNSGDNNITRFNDTLAGIVEEYLLSGGRVYLDGGEPLGWDQRNNDFLHGLFSLSETDDGDENAINGLEGQTGALTSDLYYSGSGQNNNIWIDTFSPDENGITAFEESNYGIVAVQGEGDYGQKTFCFSYNLADLYDGSYPSTRDYLLTQIINFFDLDPGQIGDINQDGILNILDIITTLNIILDGDNPTYFELLVGDLNDDGVLNILDIITMINLILAES